MQGLKKQEDKKFEKFFEIVQRSAKERGCIFFLDCGEGRDLETDDLSGEDLSGWLIPMEKTADFESEFLTGKVDDGWSDFVCFAVWDIREGNISVHFKTF